MDEQQAEGTRFLWGRLLGVVVLVSAALGGFVLPRGLGSEVLLLAAPLVYLLWISAYKPAGVYALALGGIVWMALPTVGYNPTAARRMQCGNNLKQIAIALLCYEQQYGSFPPAYLADDQGRPMHSWRVLILPFLEQQELYAQYRFDEPWNGPHNSQLAEEMPDVFRCAGDRHAPAASAWETSYVAVVGPNTAWPGARGRTFPEFTDGVHSTIMLVESDPSGISWMAPRDLLMEDLAPKINAPQGPAIRSRHIVGATVAMADASTTLLWKDIDDQVLRGLLTADGGEIVQLPQ